MLVLLISHHVKFWVHSTVFPRTKYDLFCMNALSRREEETLLKTTKARALKECDPVVKGSSPTESSSVLFDVSQNLQSVHKDGRSLSLGLAETSTSRCKSACFNSMFRIASHH